MIDPVFKTSAATKFNKFFGDISNKLFDIGRAKKRWHCPHNHRTGAKPLDHQPHCF